MSVAPAEPTAPVTEPPAAAATPAPVAPTDPVEPAPAKRSLEDLLGNLDDDARGVVLGEVSKARSEAKNLRDRLKDAEPKLTEYDRLVEASKSDLEKAQEAAKAADARTSTLLHSVAAAKIEAALTGVVPDVEAFIEDINVAKFVTEAGEVDTDAIAALREKYAAFTPAEKPGMRPNPAQGRSASPAPTLGEQIRQAQEAGDTKAAIRLKSQMALNQTD